MPQLHTVTAFLLLGENALIFCIMVRFGLFVHLFSHTCNIGHVNYRLQCIYYNTTYNIRTATQYNVINNNTKFKGHLEVQSATTSIYICVFIYLYIYTYELRIQSKIIK
jgi:hypothetical protein